jgi:prepilin-type processing-associated H-X9-DG protein/prepilin-type N-terminal cleavage/methylation domain-containing protein
MIVHSRYDPGQHMRTPGNCEKGFTAIELIAVVAVIVVLTGILIPTLARTKSADDAAVCVRNMRELVTAWQLYAGNYEDQVCNNFTIPATQEAITTKTFDNWANNLMTWSTTGLEGQSVTNKEWLKSGVLGKFSSDPVRMYKCPADTYLSAAQKRLNWEKRFRTYAMNAFCGRNDRSPTSGNGRSWADPSYRQLLSLADFPNPQKTWVTIEEHADSLNDGFFIVQLNATAWGDLPASYHKGACNFSFADGHVETHPWRSSRSKIPVTAKTFPSPQPFDAAGKQDYQWYKERTGYVRY